MQEKKELEALRVHFSQMTCFEVLVKIQVNCVIKKKEEAENNTSGERHESCKHTNAFVVLNVGR